MTDILEEIMATRDALSLAHELPSSNGPTPPPSPVMCSSIPHAKPLPVPCSVPPSAHTHSVPMSTSVLQNMPFLPNSPVAAAFTPSPRAVQDSPSPIHFRFSINDPDHSSSAHQMHYPRPPPVPATTPTTTTIDSALAPPHLSPPPPPPSSSQLPPSHSHPFFSAKPTNSNHMLESASLPLGSSLNSCSTSIPQPDEHTIHYVPQDPFMDSSAAAAVAAVAAASSIPTPDTGTTSVPFSTAGITSDPMELSQHPQAQQQPHCWSPMMPPRHRSLNTMPFSAKRHKSLSTPKHELHCDTTTTATTATTTTATTMTTTTGAASVAAASVMQPSAKSILERRAKAMAEGRREDAKLTEVERRIVRRLRNRESAERCRLRRIEHARVLEQRIHCMKEENERLVAQAEKYRATIEHYQRVIADYSRRATVFSNTQPVSSSCPAAQSHSQAVIPDAPTATVGGGRL